jgi:hypothetical protein
MPAVYEIDILYKEIDETREILQTNSDKTSWAYPIIEYLDTIKNEPFDHYFSKGGERRDLINRLSQFRFKVRGYFSTLSCPNLDSDTRKKIITLLDNECGKFHSDL